MNRPTATTTPRTAETPPAGSGRSSRSPPRPVRPGPASPARSGASATSARRGCCRPTPRPGRRSTSGCGGPAPTSGPIAVACVLIYAVFPVRTYLDQRAATRRAHEQIAEISEVNERLEDKVAALGTPDEVERIAREDYGMVRPGEESYSHPPAPRRRPPPRPRRRPRRRPTRHHRPPPDAPIGARRCAGWQAVAHDEGARHGDRRASQPAGRCGRPPPWWRSGWWPPPAAGATTTPGARAAAAPTRPRPPPSCPTAPCTPAPTGSGPTPRRWASTPPSSRRSPAPPRPPTRRASS